MKQKLDKKTNEKKLCRGVLTIFELQKFILKYHVNVSYDERNKVTKDLSEDILKIHIQHLVPIIKKYIADKIEFFANKEVPRVGTEDLYNQYVKELCDLRYILNTRNAHIKRFDNEQFTKANIQEHPITKRYKAEQIAKVRNELIKISDIVINILDQYILSYTEKYHPHSLLGACKEIADSVEVKHKALYNSCINKYQKIKYSDAKKEDCLKGKTYDSTTKKNLLSKLLGDHVDKTHPNEQKTIEVQDTYILFHNPNSEIFKKIQFSKNFRKLQTQEGLDVKNQEGFKKLQTQEGFRKVKLDKDHNNDIILATIRSTIINIALKHELHIKYYDVDNSEIDLEHFFFLIHKLCSNANSKCAIKKLFDIVTLLDNLVHKEINLFYSDHKLGSHKDDLVKTKIGIFVSNVDKIKQDFDNAMHKIVYHYINQNLLNGIEPKKTLAEILSCEVKDINEFYNRQLEKEFKKFYEEAIKNKTKPQSFSSVEYDEIDKKERSDMLQIPKELLEILYVPEEKNMNNIGESEFNSEGEEF